MSGEDVVDDGTGGVRPDLVFDVGMHLGEDTAYYLAKGYRVVAVEADPELAARGRARFRREVAEGRVVVVEGAVVDTADPTVAFYRHPVKSVWGTTEPAWASRNTTRGDSLRMDVAVVDFGRLLDVHGVPHYLKIDIEGGDRYCLSVLRGRRSAPDFVSIESEKVDWDALLAEIDLLESLGYDRFLAVQQEGLHWRWPRWPWSAASRSRHRFEEHSSGPFGHDLSGWLTKAELVARYRRIHRMYRLLGDGSFVRRTRAGLVVVKLLGRALALPLPGWYDTHATRSAVVARG